jgi:hypothetical protein
VSLEKYQVPSREVALKDQCDFPAKPCQWTPFDRKYALMQRDPLIKNYGNILKKWLKARNDSDSAMLRQDLWADLAPTLT